MVYISGIFIAVASIVFSIFHLKQNLGTYFDAVALAVVFGGTGAVATIILPWEYAKDMFRAVRELFAPLEANYKALVLECMTFIYSIEKGTASQTTRKDLAGDILRDGEELISLGFTSDRIQTILFERIHQRSSAYHYVAHAVRSLAKYPPAFGLVGTVLGLVSLMRSVADGAPSQEIGVRMAVALVATLYGLLLSNLFVNPAGENILKIASEEKKQAEVALQAVLLAADKISFLESQEMLNSFVPRNQRVDVIGQLQSQTEKEAAA